MFRTDAIPSFMKININIVIKWLVLMFYFDFLNPLILTPAATDNPADRWIKESKRLLQIFKSKSKIL